MDLREIAESHLSVIMEDRDRGFGWDITLTNPDEVSLAMVGISNDISQVIDPETGQAISGRSASVSLRISTILAAGLNLPVAISDASIKPWKVAFDDINGSPYLFKIQQSNPDRGLGAITCLLETYEE